MLKKELLIFDIDGVLLDSADSIMQSYNYVFAEMGFKPLTKKEFRKYFGLPLIETIMKRLKKRPELIEEAAEKYREYYVKKFWDKTPLFPGAKETLGYFSAKNKRLAVATTKLSKVAEKFLEGAGILDYFEIVMGRDSVKKTKPDPEVIFEILRKTGCCKEDSVFIGDTVFDIQAAKNAGVTSVAFYNGFIPKKILFKEKPDFIIKAISGLKGIIE